MDINEIVKKIKAVIAKLKKDKVALKGKVTMIHRDNDGNVLDKTVWTNLIVDAGLDEVIKLIGGGLTGSKFEYLALGSDNTSPAAWDTALWNEITSNWGSRVQATVTQETTNTTNDTLRLDNTFDFTGSLTIEEVGVFNDPSAGTMLGRKLSGTKSVSSGDSLQIIYDIIAS